MLSKIRALAFATALVASTGLQAVAEDVLLTIDGPTEAGERVDLTLKDLEAIGISTIVTRTPWLDREVTYEGVALLDLLNKVGAKGTSLTVSALNNYRSHLPVEDLRKYGVILAYRQDGAYMPVSDKGPLFVVYPFDSDPALRNEIYYARSAWQVRSITVEQ